MLSIHALVWCWVGTWSASNLDVPGDMAEAYAWGQSMQWGYFKHPPLSAWIVRAWFTLAPESAAGYAALASVSTALGLAGFAVLCREVLPARSVLLCVGAAMLAPGVTTMAQRFNCNAVLVLTWPWTAAFFVRFMRRGTGVDAAALGLAAALALLSKYFSVVLLGGLLSSALAVAPWRRRLWSPEAALALLVFVVCLAPHVFWLATRGGGPLAYAAAATGSDLSSALDRAARFGLGQVALTLPSIVFILLFRGPLGAERVAFGEDPAPGEDADATTRRGVALIGPLSLLLAMGGTLLTGARTSVVWGLPFGLLLLMWPAGRWLGGIREGHVPRWPVALAAGWLFAATLAPLWWLHDSRSGTSTSQEPREKLARALANDWQSRTGKPLRWVGGTPSLAASVSFYAPSHPRYWSVTATSKETPWIDMTAVEQDGGLIVCRVDDAPCNHEGGSFAGRLETPVRWRAVHLRHAASAAPTTFHVFEHLPRSGPGLPPSARTALGWAAR